MLRRLMAFGLGLGLLAGCAAPAQPPAASSAPVPPEPAVRVRTHWDALEPKEARPNVERRWYGELPEELHPREDYGTLVPYAGALLAVPAWDVSYMWDDELLYGLMTREGKLVTDAVWSTIYAPGYRNTRGEQETLPMLVLERASKEGGWPTGGGKLLSVCARDGSWFEEGPWWICAAGERGLMLYGPNACALLGADGNFLGRWSWEELVSSPEMKDEVLDWERVIFEPSWAGDLVWMGWTDQSRARVQVLDLSTGKVRPERAGEWNTAQEERWRIMEGSYISFDGKDTFDGTNTVIEWGGDTYTIPYGGEELYCTLERDLLHFHKSGYQRGDCAAAVYQPDGKPVIPPGRYDTIYLVNDQADPQGAFLFCCERPDGKYDILYKTGKLIFEAQDSPASLFGGVVELSPWEDCNGTTERAWVEYYDLSTAALLYRRSLRLGSDQREPPYELD